MSAQYSPDFDRRRLLRVLAGVTSVGALAACGASPGQLSLPSLEVTLDDQIAALTKSLHADQRYRGVSEKEGRRAVDAVERLIDGDTGAAQDEFESLGVTVGHIHDAPSQRDCVVASAEVDTDRTWGMIVLDPGSGTPDVLIEVPHPRSDLHTEQIGLALFRAVPGSALLIAGAHRRAAGGKADVAHQSDSLFAAVADELGQRGSYPVQLHGFADKSMPEADVVISTGKADVGKRSKRIAEALEDGGLEVCRAWTRKCAGLEGLQNAQGKAAARHGHPFLHLELSHTTRTDPTRRSVTLAALAGTLTEID